MKRIVAVLLVCISLVGCSTDSQMNETSVEENVDSTEQVMCGGVDRCAPCPGCEPVAAMCFDIESNSVPYICRPGDALPHGKSCFQANATSIYEWCCCNTGTCVPN